MMDHISPRIFSLLALPPFDSSSRKGLISLRDHGTNQRHEKRTVDFEALETLTKRYDDSVRWSKDIEVNDGLEEVGKGLTRWLDEGRLWLQRMLSCHGTIVLYVADPRGRLIRAPWELLVHPAHLDNQGGIGPSEYFLANSRLVVIRCPNGFHRPKGKGFVDPSEPFYRDDALTVVNLGAAPSAARRVDVHRLERRLDAEADAAIDFHFLSTGTLSELSNLVNRVFRTSREEVSRWPPEVVQLSARGAFGDKGGPVLLLEDEAEPRRVRRASADDIAGSLPPGARPRLLFLWAGCSAEEGPEGTWERSLCSRLSERGFMNILGLAGGEDDEYATNFSVDFYTNLAQTKDMCAALIAARRKSLEAKRSRMWHLVRWFSNMDYYREAQKSKNALPGHHLRLRHQTDRSVGMGLRVERRQVTQAITAGKNVLIHGVHGQGKTTILHWLPSALHRWRFVTLDGSNLTLRSVTNALQLLAEELVGKKDPEAQQALDEIRTRNQNLASRNLGPAVQKLLNLELMRDPLVIVVDNFEKALDVRFEGDHPIFVIRAEALEALAVLQRGFRTAYAGTPSQSRIIIASSYGFDPEQIEGPGQAWAKVCVAGLSYGEVLHHLRREWAGQAPVGWEDHRELTPGLISLFERLCMGNFEIMVRLMTDIQRSSVVQRARTIMDIRQEVGTKSFRWLDGGMRRRDNTQRQLAQFIMRDLRDARMLDHIHEHQLCRHLIRRMCYLSVPIPESVVIQFLAEGRTSEDARREVESLVDLGVLERVPDLVRSRTRAIQVNRLYREVTRQYLTRQVEPRDLQDIWPAELWWGFLCALSMAWCVAVKENRLGCLHAMHALVGWVFDLDEYCFDRPGLADLERVGHDNGLISPEDLEAVLDDWRQDETLATRARGVSGKEQPKAEVRSIRLSGELVDEVRKRVREHAHLALLYQIYRDAERASAYAERLERLAWPVPVRASDDFTDLRTWLVRRKEGSSDQLAGGREEAIHDLPKRRKQLRQEARTFLGGEEFDTDQREKLEDELARWEELRLEIMVRTSGRLAGYF